MTNQEAAEYSLRRAKIILEEAEHLRDQEVWNLVVRRCQEAVELALKGALLWAGINVPRIHDVGGILVQHADRFPAGLKSELPLLALISRTLRAEREASFYGDEDSGIPPELLYIELDADTALEQARTALRRYRITRIPSVNCV
jgi:HEPN domain-containing protein